MVCDSCSCCLLWRSVSELNFATCRVQWCWWLLVWPHQPRWSRVHRCWLHRSTEVGRWDWLQVGWDNSQARERANSFKKISFAVLCLKNISSCYCRGSWPILFSYLVPWMLNQQNLVMASLQNQILTDGELGETQTTRNMPACQPAYVR